MNSVADYKNERIQTNPNPMNDPI